ncbi:hypothetical protein HCU01_33800 [Halomonas cupida]|uniref:DUF1090 domain-containing protein n=1 Tax=Halomonas cupida TaxID=44933 RepID=A0A1M7KET5_9GAMM|nr:DUF1090 domain-containing protein [Halomonas cupida]GEN25431.1 hypothetical protein HCU01_33800 [Halomonas cupida]SHM63770.1 Protein of unknown function [Halomonas cupida]
MKRPGYLLPLCFCAAYASGALADDTNPLCSAREEEVLHELQSAEKYGNEHRIEGLQRALSNIRAHCTDESLIADAEEAVEESREEVRDRRQDLDEALREGDPDDIAEQREELQEAEDELHSDIQQLRALQGPR